MCVYVYVYVCVCICVWVGGRSIYQECEFFIKLAWEINSVRGTFGKSLKTIPRVDPSHVREIG